MASPPLFKSSPFYTLTTSATSAPTPDWISAIAAIASVGVAVWAVWLVAKTLAATRRAVAVAEQSNEVLATSSKDMLDVAKVSNDIAQNAFYQANRPFIFVDRVQSNFREWVDEFSKDDLAWHFRITNYGPHPAVVQRVGYGAYMAPEGFRTLKDASIFFDDLGHVDKWLSHSLMQAMSMNPKKLSAVLS